MSGREDRVARATAFGGTVRAVAARTTGLCAEATRIHDLSPVASAALGRLLTAAVLLSRDLKTSRESVSLVLHGDGPLRGMTAVCGGDAKVRGYCGRGIVESTYRGPGKLDVGAAVGMGTLTVVKDLGMGEPYTGRVELVSGEIGEDVAAYLAVSEQIPSVVSLGVRLVSTGVDAAGGFLVQLLPDAGPETAELLERRAAAFPEVSTLLSGGISPEELLARFLGDPEMVLLDAAPCSYDCPCSRERMERNLLSLGRVELDDLASDPDGIELDCHFCGTRYRFAQPEVAGLSKEAYR